MPLIATAKGSKDFPLPEATTHVARCVQVLDIGTHIGEYQGKKLVNRKVRLAWELPDERAVFKEGGSEEPFVLGKEYTLSLNEKASLRKDLESWRGKTFTDQELEGFDLSKLIGQPALLSVVHKTKPDRTVASIQSVSKLGKGMACPPQVMPSLVYSIDEGRNDTFQKLPEWLRNKIEQCSEWKNPPPVDASTDDHNNDDVPF